MLGDMLKEFNLNFGDTLKNAEAGQGTIKDNMDDLCDILEDEILQSKAGEEEKKAMLKRLRTFCNTETNIMLVGATGCGKSSTINALFAVGENDENVNAENPDEKIADKTYVGVAKVGSKADPETKDIEKYKIGNLVLWDTPGLGDGTEIDEHHREVISELLREEDEEGNALIDLVLVILDGSTRDLGTSYKILNDVIIPEEKMERLLSDDFLRPGDVIGVSRGAYEHYAIYLGNAEVIHYAGENTDFKGRVSIHKAPFSDFIKDSKDYFVVSFEEKYPVKIHASTKFISGGVIDYNSTSQYSIYSAEETVKRALSRLGETKYSLIQNNCEHFAMWCKTGVAESAQVRMIEKYVLDV